MEAVLAAVAQFDNDIRAERTVVGIKEALARGRWTFQAPLGYRNVRRTDGTATLEVDPGSGPLIRKGFGLYASGLHSKKAVLQQLNDEGLRTKRVRRVAPQTWDRILKNPIYAGRIQMDNWGIDAEADFEPLIGSWSSGKAGRRYAYYRCPSCSRPSIAKDRLESLFLE